MGRGAEMGEGEGEGFGGSAGVGAGAGEGGGGDDAWAGGDGGAGCGGWVRGDGLLFFVGHGWGIWEVVMQDSGEVEIWKTWS